MLDVAEDVALLDVSIRMTIYTSVRKRQCQSSRDLLQSR